jgi:hypothetical protein
LAIVMLVSQYDCAPPVKPQKNRNVEHKNCWSQAGGWGVDHISDVTPCFLKPESNIARLKSQLH